MRISARLSAVVAVVFACVYLLLPRGPAAALDDWKPVDNGALDAALAELHRTQKAAELPAQTVVTSTDPKHGAGSDSKPDSGASGVDAGATSGTETPAPEQPKGEPKPVNVTGLPGQENKTEAFGSESVASGPVPKLVVDATWKPPPNETQEVKLPNGETKKVKCRADFDGPCHAYAPLVEANGAVPNQFPAGTLQRFDIEHGGVLTASLVSYDPALLPSSDGIFTPSAIVPIHLVPDEDEARRTYLESGASEIHLWHAAFVAPKPGEFILVVRLRQQTSAVTDPALCTTLASYPDSDMEAVSGPVNYSDPVRSGSAYVRELRQHCGWNKTREDWFDLMKNDPGRPANVPWAKSIVFQRNVTVTAPPGDSGGIAVPRTSGRMTKVIEALFRFVYRPPPGMTAADIAADPRLFSLGTYESAAPDLPPSNASKATPGNIWMRPTVEMCPWVFERHAVGSNCSSRPGQLYFRPLFAPERKDWLISKERLARCVREERVKIVGDSLAGLFTHAMNCACMRYTGKNCFWAPMDSRGANGQVFPLHYFASLHPPEGTDPPRELLRYLVSTKQGSGVVLWQLGAWPIAYTNSTVWQRAFTRILEEMQTDLGTERDLWRDWAQRRDRHRTAEGEREVAESSGQANGSVNATGPKARNFKEEPVPQVPRRYLFATATPFQTFIEPLTWLRMPAFQTLGRALKYNHLLLEAHNAQWALVKQADQRVEIVDTFRILEQRFDARTDNAHYCPGATFEVAMVLWQIICRDVD
ncbi:hypothetical protein DFJ74DRAFT_287750 [Hyaloraphidium curvatum]|nr:hypothetical protein DFJ74DRAFT_287750 [Hyaloraphidium curvatum]